jgi:hypothetical protein
MQSRKLFSICLSALLFFTAGCSATNGEKVVSSGTGSAASSLSSESVFSSVSPSTSSNPTNFPARSASSSNSTTSVSSSTSSNPSKSPVITGIADPTYSSHLNFDKDGNHIYTFANGSVDAAPGDCLLMLNGKFSNARVIIKNDCALVPVSVIQQACGADVLWSFQAGNIIKIHNAGGSIGIKMIVGQVKADVNGKTEELETPPVMENNTAYVPLRFICKCFGKVIGSLPAGQDVGNPKSTKSLAFNSVVWVDDYTAEPTDATLTWLKAQMNQALTSLKNHRSTVLKDTAPNDPGFSQIANDINHTYYVGNVGRYALYQGPYPTLVDVNSKTIYFRTVSSGRGWSIWKANMSDPETFMVWYFAE